MIDLQLMEHLIRNNKLAAHQRGNRKFHSTETALLYVTDQLLQAMDSKKVSIMVLLDMSKAFDSIRHDILLSKLQYLDFSQGAFDWFQSYLISEDASLFTIITLETENPLILTKSGQRRFLHRAVNIWNNLDKDFKQLSLPSFEKKLKTHVLENYFN